MTTYDDQPTLAGAHAPQTPPSASVQPAAAACLQASQLLRRRIHRYGVGVGDEQALLAVCHLLDALSRGLADTPTRPGPVERATLRLADQLHRAEHNGTHPPGRNPTGQARDPHRTAPDRR